MKRILLTYIICLLGLQVYADVFIIEEDKNRYALESKIEVLQEGIKPYTIADLENPGFLKSFQHLSNIDFELQSGPSYWGKIELQNRLPDAKEHLEWVLRFSNTWTTLEVFVQNVDGSITQQRSGTFVPQVQKKFEATTEGNQIKLFLMPDETVTVFFRGRSERKSIPPNFRTSLQDADDFYSALQYRKIENAVFVGFVLMMLLYNLILFFFGRDRSYIYYSIYLLTLVIYASFISEDLADWLEPYLFSEHPEYLYFGKLVIYLGLMSYLAFVQTFLDLDKLMPRWSRYFTIIFWLGIPLLIFDIFLIFQSNFSYAVADLVTVSYIILFVVSVFVFIYPLFKTRDKKGYFIVGGIIFMGLGFLFTAIARGNSPAFSLIYFKVGTILEIIVFSLGLAYRQREIERARQASYFELEKNRIVRAQEQAEAERLKELNRFKSRFYTNITHEFRTPLTVILGMNENIKGHVQEKNLIRRNSKNLLQLINQLLDLSKLETGSLKLELIQSDIISYLQYLTESFYSMAQDKDVRLTFYSEEEALLMDYDEVKMQHIVYNLLSNAIKFTPSSGKVILHVSRTDQSDQSYLNIKVKDNGEGIEAEQLPYIFDRFYQVEAQKGNGREGDGSGVGLALTKELVELMQGEVDVKSTPGQGTEFTVRLLISRNAELIVNPRLPDAPMLPEDKGVAERSLSALTVEAEQSAALQRSANKENIQAKEEQYAQVLLIEDNPDVVTYIQSILSDQYAVSVARNGQDGIDQAIEQIPDIIISDVMMPEKDGYEVCETLKQDERTSHIPIILLTAKATTEDRVQGLTFGADAYLTKPFNKAELFVRLEKLTTLRRTLQLRYSGLASSQLEQIAEPTVEDEFIQKIKDVVEENISNADFSVPQLADLLLLSQTQVYRKLKALTGKTPSHFIRSIRLQKGMELLQNSDLNISEIAYDVGFSDPNYFSRTFHQEFGKSPRDVRSM